MSIVSLRPDSNLLDPSFETYKLSLKNIPRDEVSVPEVLQRKAPKVAPYCVSKYFVLFNHLFQDVYTGNVYYVNINHEIIMLSEPSNEQVGYKCVFKIPITNSENALHPSMVFASPSIVCISDGVSKLFVVSKNETWEVIENFCLNSPCHLLHSITQECGNISIAFLHFIEKEITKTQVNCLILEKKNNTFSIASTLQFDGYSFPDYVSFEEDCKHLNIISEKQFSSKSDSDNNQDVSLSTKNYVWYQSQDSIDVVMKLPPNISSKDLNLLLESQHLQLKYSDNEDYIFNHDFQHRIDLEGSTWSTMEDELTIHLLKHDKKKIWNHLLVNDDRGELVYDEGLLDEWRQKLDHLTAEGDALTNPLDYKECLDDTSNSNNENILTRFNTDSGTLSNLIYLNSQQVLFSSCVTPSNSNIPSFCLHSNVDGLIYSSSPKDNIPFTHVATFHALGFIQASKREKKFILCPKSCSYVAISEGSQRIYVYMSPQPIDSTLRNRKTGKVYSSIADQYVISLGNTDIILGMCCYENCIVVLQATSIIVCKFGN